MATFIRIFSEIRITDIPLADGIAVPDGFVVTADAFKYFLSGNKIDGQLKALLQQLDIATFSNLREIGKQARALLTEARLPDDIVTAIKEAYGTLCRETPFKVAVHGSVTAEDLPNASFAGQHESYLNIKSEDSLLKAVHKCYVSLYTDRAIKYREDNGFAQEQVALYVIVQKMIRCGKTCPGAGFMPEWECCFTEDEFATATPGDTSIY